MNKVRLSIHLKNVHKVEINDRNLRLDIYENGEKSKLCDLCGKDFDKPKTEGIFILFSLFLWQSYKQIIISDHDRDDDLSTWDDQS